MASCGLCRLCGYQSHSNDNNAQCPVCGEAYDRLKDGHTRVPKLAQATGIPWCGVPQLKSRVGGLDRGNTNETGANGSTYLDLDLQSLLDLIPEQQARKKRAQRDVVRATEAALAPAQANSGRRDPDVVCIQRRVDPTMTVLKVRVATYPCHIASAAQGQNIDCCVSRDSTV